VGEFRLTLRPFRNQRNKVKNSVEGFVRFTDGCRVVAKRKILVPNGQRIPARNHHSPRLAILATSYFLVYSKIKFRSPTVVQIFFSVSTNIQSIFLTHVTQPAERQGTPIPATPGLKNGCGENNTRQQNLKLSQIGINIKNEVSKLQ
jgi:hypothetical protein